MNYRMTASLDAIHACDYEDAILWLQPRSALEYPNANARDAFRLVTASLGLGALLTFGSAASGIGPALAHTAKPHSLAAPKNTKAAVQRPHKVSAPRATKVTFKRAARMARPKPVQVATPRPVPVASHGQRALGGPSRKTVVELPIPADIVVPPMAAADVPLIVVEEIAKAVASMAAVPSTEAGAPEPGAPAADVPLIVVEEIAKAVASMAAVPSTEVGAPEPGAPAADESEIAALANGPAVETHSTTATRDPSAAESVAATPQTAFAEPGNTDETSPQIAATPAAYAQPEQDSFEPRPGYDPHELLQFDDMRVPRWIVETILKASDVTGVDPVYMMALADKESSFIPANRAGTSSAEGLFQFISSTWLEVVRSFGAKHGLVTEAAAIERSSGQLSVSDEAMREHVLGLRRDPYLSALMAAEMMKRDRAKVERRLGRSISRSEFYLAHFFGVDSASKFMALLDGKPKQSAPRVFPRAARANRTLFFAKKGRKTRHLSVAEVYSRIDGMIDKRLGRYQGVMTAVSDASL